MTLKKSLSVFLAFVMLISIFSLGLTGIAASINYATQYDNLAGALKNEHVRDLTNYTIENKTPEQASESFNSEANGFIYDHRVIAADNAAGDILKAANIFYFIAESFMSTTYNVGKYNATLVIEEIAKNLKDRFTGEGYYEDFYGAQYFPSEEEEAAYKNAVELITAAGREVSQASLTGAGIYFMEKNEYEYYNIDSILKYFMGNNVKINAGNWYHRNAFIVETSLEEALVANGGSSTLLTTRTAVYEIDYARTFIEEGTKAVYAFKAPSTKTVYDNYGSEFGFTSSKSEDLSKTSDGITRSGQASGLLIKVETDDTTVLELQNIRSMFGEYIDDGADWDKQFTTMTEAQIATEVPNASELVDAFEELTATYSNDALMAIFGDDIGDMVTLTYILKSISQSPTRIVRNGKRYTATADRLNDIVRDMDALVYDDTSDTAQRVGTIVKQFFNTNNSLFEGTAVAGMDFVDLNELVHHLVTGLLFRDSIVNMLVELIYPMIVDLLEEKLYDAIRDAVGDTITGWANDIIDDVIERNDLAIYPNTLADRINEDYPNKFNSAIAVLRAAGSKWENVNYDALDWGVDSASYSEKAELFIDALCAGLGGFMRAVVTVMCGDAEYTENAGWSYDKDQYNEYLDKYLLSLGIAKGYLRSQGGYTKLIVPLFRVLGIPEMDSGAKYNTTITGYVTPADYHAIIMSKDGAGKYRYNYSLRLILAPIIYWVENILAQRPFETIWALIPNLVYFFTRQGSSPTSIETIRSNCTDDDVVDRTHGGIADGVPQYEQLQSYNLLDILDSIYVLIDIDVLILVAWKNFTVNVGSLGDLIDKDELLGSVNGLLNEVLNLEYVVGESGVLNTVAYANADGIAVMPDSYEYATNKDDYPIGLQYVYANENETEYRATQDDVFYKEITNPEYIKATYKIPALQEAKLTSVTTLKADGTLVEPNAIGVLNTDWNTIDVRNPGVVLMYVLRFVLSALGYKYDLSLGEELPFLIECFGLDIDMELFQGLNLKDIIFNVMLHPDEAICALLELFYSNEQGNKYENIPYTYAPEPIDYHNDVLLDSTINPGLTYGTAVRYSKYWTREYAEDTLDDLDDLATNVLKILTDGDVIELDGFEDGLTGFLQNLLNENVFNDKLMNTLFNTIYQLLGGLNGTVGFNIEAILEAALDIHYDPATIGRTIEVMMGKETPASHTIKNAASWNDIFQIVTDPETGEAGDPVDVEFDWGIDTAEKPHYAFLKTAAALLAPAAFAIRFLFMDQHLDILGLIDIDSYAGYQYAFIGLLEALSCPNILPYKEYYEKGLAEQEGTLLGDANTIYYLLSPVLGLVDNVYTDPLTTVLGLIPNLLFFISIGGLNDLVNNLVHFAYVLLDILKPIVNGYDLLSGLISNINISGFILNLSLPLDLDFNSIISELLDALVGDSLEISGVKISLPYIDFHTLCCGTLKRFDSKEVRQTVQLNSAGGADLITALFRLVFEVVYMEENQAAIAQIIENAIKENENSKTDLFDLLTLKTVLFKAFDIVEEYEVLDMALYLIYFLVTKITPLSQTIIDKNIDIITPIKNFDIKNPTPIVELLTKLISDEEESTPGEIEIPKATMSLWERIKAFFERIINFFKGIFS